MIGDLDRATGLAAVLLSAMGDVAGARGSALAELRRDLGALTAGRRAALKSGSFLTELSPLFGSALAAGFKAADFAKIRLQAETLAAAATPAVAVVAIGFVQFCLIAEARVWSAATFESRDQVDTVRNSMAAAFDRAIEAAADAGTAGIMRALTSLNAALQRHLITTARPLPRMIIYSTPRPIPSLVLAHRLFADASRRDELEDENHVVAPLFMPAAGRALSK